jgi:hypothetical protein
MSEEYPPSELPPSERPPQPPHYSWEEEKEKEKEQEKEQEKEAEKGAAYAEKYRRDPLSAAFWAGILILAGLIFLADNMEILPSERQFSNVEVWHWIAVGAGLLLFLEAIIRLVSPDYARPVRGRFIFAGALIAVGLSSMLGNPEIIWPLILVIVGVSILFGVIFRR